MIYFLDLLRKNVLCEWDIGDSANFLYLKLLQEYSGVDIPKYGGLATIIHEYLKNKRPITYDTNVQGERQENQIYKQAQAFYVWVKLAGF